jgi:aryl-alcohol dehydrogenase-like predicted oxidoreductase
MLKRRLGRTTLNVPPIILGGNVFGWTADRQTSFRLLDRFFEAGFNAIDTANSYSRWVAGHFGGESETIIGDWMKARGNRDQIILITKVGSDMGQGHRDLSAAHIQSASEDSLRRLQTDVIDLYLSHWYDERTPFEETLQAYARLIDNGKVRHIGASNLNAVQLSAALKVARDNALPRYEVLEPEYNLYNRSNFDGELSDLCIAESLGVISYYSLAAGFLTGKYKPDSDLSAGSRGSVVKDYFTPRGMRILDALELVASRHAAKQAEVAIAWVLTRPGITAPIASATTSSQLDSLVRASSINLTSSDLAILEAASKPLAF